jgi:hypothetical protein
MYTHHADRLQSPWRMAPQTQRVAPPWGLSEADPAIGRVPNASRDIPSPPRTRDENHPTKSTGVEQRVRRGRGGGTVGEANQEGGSGEQLRRRWRGGEEEARRRLRRGGEKEGGGGAERKNHGGAERNKHIRMKRCCMPLPRRGHSPIHSLDDWALS